MDAAIGFLLVLIFLALLTFGLALVYKDRTIVKKWLNAPYYAGNDQKLNLKRRIEDSARELAEIEAAESKGGD